MSRDLFFGLAGAVLVLFNIGVALRAIFAGKFKPHRVTYGIFSLITLVTFSNQVINGGGYSALFLGISFIGVSFMFLLSFKYGMGGTSTLDKFTLFAALLLALYWILSGDSRYSTVIAIAIDVIALVPTVHKAYVHPKTEIYLNWLIGSFGGLLSAFAITEMDWILFIFPLYIFFANFFVVGAKYFGHLKQRKIIATTS